MSTPQGVAYFRAIALGRSEAFVYGHIIPLHHVRLVIFTEETMHPDGFPIPSLESYSRGRRTPWRIRD